MRPLLMAPAVALALAAALLGVAAPATAVACNPLQAAEDPAGYVDCTTGCPLGGLQRFLRDPSPGNLFWACPA